MVAIIKHIATHQNSEKMENLVIRPLHVFEEGQFSCYSCVHIRPIENLSESVCVSIQTGFFCY